MHRPLIHNNIHLVIIASIVLFCVVSSVYSAGKTGDFVLTVSSGPTFGAVSPGPAPPTLNAPVQIFQPGAVFGGFTVNGTGAVDDTNALQAAVNAGDVQINAGTYLINTVTNTVQFPTAVVVPSGRNIRCGPGSFPPAGNVIINMPSGGNIITFSFQGGSGGSIFGCSFRGTFFNTAPPSGPAAVNEFVQLLRSGATVANNDMNGIGGDIGAIQTQNIGQGSTATITNNSVENCGYEMTQVSQGDNINITNNTLTDCTCCTEGTFAGFQPHIHQDGNDLKVVNGQGTFHSNGFVPEMWMIPESGANNGTCDFRLSTMNNNRCNSTGITSVICNTVHESTCFVPTVNGNVFSGSCNLGDSSSCG